jgi:N-acetylneuraminic acid mutarotase
MATLNGTVVMFGGYDPDNFNDYFLADTWTWDGAAWTQQFAPGPGARYGAAMATLSGQVVLFGGTGSSKEFLDDTWTWDGTSWTQLDVTGPTARAFAVMATF